MTQVSVILPVRNGAATIGVQLRALDRQQTVRSREVVVADNGSTDRTAEIVLAAARTMPSVRLVDAGDAAGAAHAKNVGVDASVGSILLFCDADDEVDEHWLDRLAAAVERHEFAGGVLDRRRFSDAPTRLRLPVSVTLNRTADGHLFPVGANVGITRALFERIGGFDPAYVGGNEDADLGLKATAAGRPPQFVPDAVVHYRDRSTWRATFRQFRLYGRTEPLLYRKHPAVIERRGVIAAGRFWARTVVMAATSVRHRDQRILVVRRLGRGIGRIQGTLEHRVLFL